MVSAKLRTALVVVHRWFGVVGGLWLLALALTGSILVFYEEIDGALNPDLAPLPTLGPGATFDAIAAAAVERHPGSYASFVHLPHHAGEPMAVYLAPRAGVDPESVPAGLHVFVDPATGGARGERVWGAPRLDRRHFAPFLYKLHMDLHLGAPMAWFLGLLGLAWALDHVVATLLSFPTPSRWLESFRVRRGARGFPLAYGLHRALGLWLLPVTFVLAVSGVYFEWYETVVAAVDKVSPVTKDFAESAPPLAEPRYAPPVGIDRAVAAARAHAGGAALDSLFLLPEKGLYALRLKDPRDLAGYGMRVVHVDSGDGAVVSDRHEAEGSAGDVLIAWQYPLHSGRAFGWPGRIAILAAGLAVSTLTVTGFVIWGRKLAARRSAGPRRRRKLEPLGKSRSFSALP
jgi:uncharacterized iron-regulated membrane protein